MPETSEARKRLSTSPSRSHVVAAAETRIRHGEATRLAPREARRILARHFSASEIEGIVAPPRTFARRLAQNEKLTVEESERALRLARIGNMADRVFGNEEKAGRWLRDPNPVFNGQRPLDILITETGGRAVETLLGQIEHGIFI
jgi:putative toxin-antitoxin system antitoxin component (TIGR02293 family)